MVDVEADKISEFDSRNMIEPETFEWLWSVEDATRRNFLIDCCEQRCKELKFPVTKFKQRLKEYHMAQFRGEIVAGSYQTAFTNQPLILYCGNWICNDKGVMREEWNKNGDFMIEKYASPVPLLITEVLQNVDDDVEKIRIMFYKEGWKSIVTNCSTASSTSKIIELADKGLEVNSDNAKLLVQYIAELRRLNRDIIPVNRAVSRLGWCENEFMPYTKDLKFDGEKDNKFLFDCIRQHGEYQKWFDCVNEVRKNKVIRMQIAASLASPILSKINALPFILHVWGETGSGKTVGMIVAMSIWGDPSLGKLVRTMNSTPNAMMSTAGFLHNIPFAGDELQTIKTTNWSNYDTLIMRVCEGVDRGRMEYNKVIPAKTWDCTFLFTGEESCTRSNSGGGVKNRVIEVESDAPLIQNGNEVVSIVTENFGHLGKEWIGILEREELGGRFNEIYKEIMETCDTTQKQASSMAVLLLADELSSKHIFHTEPLKITDVSMYLQSKADVDVAVRAYNWLTDFIAANSNKFSGETTGEVWGRFDGNYVYFNRMILARELSANNFEFDAVKKKWSDYGYIMKDTQGRYFHCTKCHGVKANYVKIELIKENVKDSYEVPPF